jgi:hypothetical protein
MAYLTPRRSHIAVYHVFVCLSVSKMQSCSSTRDCIMQCDRLKELKYAIDELLGTLDVLCIIFSVCGGFPDQILLHRVSLSVTRKVSMRNCTLAIEA